MDKYKEFLLSAGWKEVMPNCSFEKSRYEIVFDTGSYVEFYDKETKKRIMEGLSSNLDSLLAKLEKKEVENNADE